MLKDEHQALQLAFTALEDKYQKAQDDNRELIERWMVQKAKDADIMNEENAVFMRWARVVPHCSVMTTAPTAATAASAADSTTTIVTAAAGTDNSSDACRYNNIENSQKFDVAISSHTKLQTKL